MAAQWWLVENEGTRRRIDPGGVLVGRAPTSDLILTSPKASRSQALIYLDDEAPRLVVLGKATTHVNGARTEREIRLAAGDRVTVPGKELVVERGEGPDRATSSRCWVLARPDGTYFGITQTPFTVGSHAAVDLRLDSWPEHALALHLIDGHLHVTAGPSLLVDDAPLAAGTVHALTHGSRLRHEHESLQVLAVTSDLGATLSTGAEVVTSPVPVRVELEFLPRGGRLSVHAGGEERRVYLPGHRCDLMALLLQPPEPHARGDLLDDEVVIARIWPNQARTRVDLNTLIYRLRRDLEGAGLDASAFVQRAPGGGGTTLGLPPHVAMQVR